MTKQKIIFSAAVPTYMDAQAPRKNRSPKRPDDVSDTRVPREARMPGAAAALGNSVTAPSASCFPGVVGVLATLLLAVPAAAFAAETPTLNAANTAWMLTSTALVLFMTLPGLALFYGGLVRTKNVLSVLMQCFAITGVVSIVWVLFAYSLAFGDGGESNAWIGGLAKSFLAGVGVNTLKGNIPETVFAMFQMTFAIITPALVVGGFAERMRFSSMLLFSLLWLLLVYVPVCHWVWGRWLATKSWA